MFLKYLFATCLATWADSQHLPKLGRLPGISNSLVNLGKMDISFHFNNNGAGGRYPDQFQHVPDTLSLLPAPSSFSSPRSISQPLGVCPCIRNAMKEISRSNPIDFISKIMTSNNLLTNSKEPISSSLCCGSMEQIEETVIVDLTKPQEQSSPNVLPAMSFPFALDAIMRAPSLPRIPIQKPKSFEVYLYPNKKDMVKLYPKKTRKSLDKKRILAVGDKELRNEFPSLNIRSFQPIKTSVKKDLNIQEKVMGKIEEEPAKEGKELEFGKPKDDKVKDPASPPLDSVNKVV